MSGDGSPLPTDGLGALVTAGRPLSEHWPPTSRYGANAVVLANDRHGVVARSVEALAALPDDLPPSALVGGLAVMVRLYAPHRVTTDFDEVSQGRDETIERLLSLGAQRTSSGVALVEHGVRLDLLDAELDLAELAAMATQLSDPLERRGLALALVCRYALETAVLTDIIVVEEATVVARVALPVAVAGALVAMKVHAALAPDRAPGKAASDAYDAWRLVRAWGPTAVAEDLSRAPVPLVLGVQADLRRLYDDDVDRTVRWLASTSVTGVEQLVAQDLEPIAGVADLLEPFTVWDQGAGVEQ